MKSCPFTLVTKKKKKMHDWMGTSQLQISHSGTPCSMYRTGIFKYIFFLQSVNSCLTCCILLKHFFFLFFQKDYVFSLELSDGA